MAGPTHTHTHTHTHTLTHAVAYKVFVLSVFVFSLVLIYDGSFPAILPHIPALFVTSELFNLAGLHTRACFRRRSTIYTFAQNGGRCRHTNGPRDTQKDHSGTDMKTTKALFSEVGGYFSPQ